MLGRGANGYIRLGSIYFLLLLTLAIALGGLGSLRERMEDPFTQQVELQLSTDTDIGPIIDHFSDPLVQTDLGIAGLELNGIRHHSFRNPSEALAEKFRCLSFDPDSSRLWQRIQSDPDLLVKGHLPKEPQNQCGVIATMESLKKLGLDPLSAKYVLWQAGTGYDGARNYTICLPLLAVVKRLPSNCDMAMSVSMAEMLNDPDDTGFFEPDAKDNTLDILLRDKLEKNQTSYLEAYLQVAPNDFRKETIRLDDTLTMQKLSVNFPGILDLGSRADLIDSMGVSWPGSFSPLLTFETFCNTPTNENLKRYYLYFLFDRLDDIDRFNDTLYTQFGLQLDLTKVKSTENFASVAALTYTLTVMLFLFGLAGLAYHAHRQVREHLERSRKGIGTLAAFGLAPTALARIFLQVIMRAHILAALLALGLGLCLQAAFSLLSTGPSISFTHPLVWLALPLSWGVLALTVHTLVNKHLRHSPGDLIHGR